MAIVKALGAFATGMQLGLRHYFSDGDAGRSAIIDAMQPRVKARREGDR